MSGAIPVTLVTGFLGAGKTTLIRRLLTSDHGRRLAVVVNDFGALDIDAQWVSEVVGEREMVRLTNGCICCSIRGDLLEAVAALASQSDPPEQVIVETSGVSDPQQLVQTFTLTELAHHVRLDAVVTVVDVSQHDALLERDRELATHQAAAADLVMLNKIDIAPPRACERARTFIECTAPGARVLETIACDVPTALVLAGPQPGGRARRDSRTAAAPENHSHHARYATFAWTSNDPFALDALKLALDALPAAVLRAKGIAYVADVPDEQAHLNYVGRRATLVRGGAWRAQPETRLTFITTMEPDVADLVRTTLEAAVYARELTRRNVRPLRAPS